MPPAPPLITLLTDFGTRDSFVASMKGVILAINPSVHLVDLSHDIPPHAIREAAYCLNGCYKTFPEGTVHVAVVDPGVGSTRRPLVVKTTRYFFVAPDNGVLTPILDTGSDVNIRLLDNPRYRLESPGSTFHGRDLFAPAAAWLTTGVAWTSFGPAVSDPVRLDWPTPVCQGAVIRGEVVHIDRFGNLISNIEGHRILSRPLERVRVTVSGRAIGPLVSHYAAANSGIPQALINSHGMLEVFVREQPACDVLKAGIGAVIEVLG